MDSEPAAVLERGMLAVPEEAWRLAVGRAEVIARLAAMGTVGLDGADAAAAELGVSRRLVYVLLGRWRAGEGVVSDLIPGKSSGRLEVSVCRPVLAREDLSSALDQSLSPIVQCHGGADVVLTHPVGIDLPPPSTFLV